MRARLAVVALLALPILADAAVVHGAQALSTRELQRLLREASDSVDSARNLLARDEPRGARGRLEEAESIYRRILDANPEQKEAAVGLSAVLFLTRRYDDGVRLMGAFYERDADDADVTHQLALHLYRSGRQADAVPLLEAVAGDPHRFDAAWLLAVHFYREASWERGLPHAEAYVAARPDDDRAQGLLGTYYLKTERFAEAVAALDRAIAATPDNLAARINRANALFRMDALDRAATEYEALVAEHPERSRLTYNLAAVRIKQGRCADAVPLLERFIARESQDGTARYFRANCLLELGRLTEARAAFEDARDGAANNPWIHLGLSRIALGEGRADDAVRHARDAVAISPSSWEMLSWLGTALRKAGLPAEALGWHDKALAIAPDDASLHLERGRDLWSLERFADAGGAFDAALALDPELTVARTAAAAARTAVGVNARAAGDAPGAERAFTDALALAADYAPARTNLALLTLHGGRVDDAERLLDGAPRDARGPDHAAVLAFVRLQRGDADGAAAAVERARAGGSQLDGLLREVEAWLAALGESWESAAEGLESAYEAAPRDELDAARALAWLELGLERLGRGDGGGARVALTRASRSRAALSGDDRATLDLALAAQAVVVGDDPERATRALAALLRAPAYRAGRYAAVRDLGQAYVAYGYLRADAPERALAALDQLGGDAGNAAAAASMRAHAQDLLARRAFARADFAAAERVWRALAEGAPEDSTSRVNLAAALFAQGRTGEAERVWRALAEANESAVALYNLGVVADRRGEHQEAREHFRGAVEAGVPNADAVRERLRAKERVFGAQAGGGGS